MSDFHARSVGNRRNALEAPERYSLRHIVLGQPFKLGNDPDVYPAGCYEVETAERALEAGISTAYVRASTTLIIPTKTGTVSRQVRASDLVDALERDRELSVSKSDESPNRDLLRDSPKGRTS